MNRILKTIGSVTVIFGFMTYAFAGSYGLKYKLAPGQRWVAKMSSQSETTFMGNKNVTKTKTVIEYKVTKGPKKGWVSLLARVNYPAAELRGIKNQNPTVLGADT